MTSLVEWQRQALAHLKAQQTVLIDKRFPMRPPSKLYFVGVFKKRPRIVEGSVRGIRHPEASFAGGARRGLSDGALRRLDAKVSASDAWQAADLLVHARFRHIIDGSRSVTKRLEEIEYSPFWAFNADELLPQLRRMEESHGARAR